MKTPLAAGIEEILSDRLEENLTSEQLAGRKLSSLFVGRRGELALTIARMEESCGVPLCTDKHMEWLCSLTVDQIQSLLDQLPAIAEQFDVASVRHVLQSRVEEIHAALCGVDLALGKYVDEHDRQFLAGQAASSGIAAAFETLRRSLRGKKKMPITTPSPAEQNSTFMKKLRHYAFGSPHAERAVRRLKRNSASLRKEEGN
jgi:hypothetical protein